ncbi:MAG TPA: DNA-3-methyladenine glycosylase 2 family protein [Candidatus Paceibacterota bacterium]|nr:DNA-3-methyladenine glycosylase 2 family protein [Candidatus Paceibacterota bacterium]
MKNIPSEILKDKVFGPLVKIYGAPDFTKYHGRTTIFEALIRSIIYQQLSGKAAATIRGRFAALFPRRKITPQKVLLLSDENMRGAGISRGKVAYVRDLAQKFIDGTVPHRSFKKMTNEEIIVHLTKVHGIGEWTVHMLLIFTLHRPDVLPVGDLAIRKGFQKAYGLKTLPTAKEMEKLALSWRKYASFASWYLWRLVD